MYAIRSYYALVLCLFIYFLSQSSLLSGDLFGTQAIADSIEERRQKSLFEDRQPDPSDQQPGFSRHGEQGPADPLADYSLVGIINSKKIMKSKIDGSIMVIQ